MAGLVGYTKISTISSEIESPIKYMVKPITIGHEQKVHYFTHKFLDMAFVTLPKNHSHSFAYYENCSKGALVYGKIFNLEKKLKILKSKGHIFKDECNPAEFIVHAYEEYGNETFRDLNGSFVITLYCINKPTLLLITDRFGTRPLYYAFKDDELLFSSHSRAILNFPFPRELNEKTLVKYLLYGKIGIIGDETWFEGIKLMPPASILTFTDKEYKIEKYWDLEYSSQLTNKKDIVRKLVKAFKRAVNTRVTSIDGKLCVCLSGGLDSRSVLGALNDKNLRKVLAVTFGTKDCDDISIARKVTKKLDVKHVVIEYNPNDLVKHAKDVVYLTDGQDTVNVSYIPYVSKRMREDGIRYYATGYMLDLTLGGSYLTRDLFNAKDFHDFMLALEKKYTLFRPFELKKLLKEKFHKNIAVAHNEFVRLAKQAKGDNFPNKSDYFAINTRVRRYTLMGSIISREFVEELIPTIDNGLVEIIRTIHPSLRYNHNIYREFLICLNKKLAKIPYQKVSCPPIYPLPLWFFSTGISFLRRNAIEKLSRGRLKTKRTYFNFDKIIRVSPAWKELIEDTLFNGDSLIYQLSYLNRNQVEQIVDKHWKGAEKNGQKIAFLISLELFLRFFFHQESEARANYVIYNKVS